MTFPEWMAWLGIKIPDLVAGMFGGVVKALVFHRDKPGETVFSGIVGGLMANYLGESLTKMAASFWPSVQASQGAVCFAVGIAAMVICQAIIDKAKAWSSKPEGANG